MKLVYAAFLSIGLLHAQTGVNAGQIKCSGPGLTATTQVILATTSTTIIAGSPLFFFQCVALDPLTLKLDLTTVPPTLRGVPQPSTVTLPVFVDDEVPTGTIDGINTVFSLSAPPTGLRLFRNGIKVKNGLDYTLSGAVITFAGGDATPKTGDLLSADYRK